MNEAMKEQTRREDWDQHKDGHRALSSTCRGFVCSLVEAPGPTSIQPGSHVVVLHHKQLRKSHTVPEWECSAQGIIKV